MRERKTMPASINIHDCASCLGGIPFGYVCDACASNIPDMPDEFTGKYREWVDGCVEIETTYDTDTMNAFAEAVRLGIVELAREFEDFYHGPLRGTEADFFQEVFYATHGSVPYGLEDFIDWEGYAAARLDDGDYVLIETGYNAHMLYVY